MEALAPNVSRIAYLLRVEQGLREDLAMARTADEAANIRADLHAIQHSLWLAGYQLEEMG